MNSCNECTHFKACKYKNKVMKLQKENYPLQYECRLFEEDVPDIIKEARMDLLNGKGLRETKFFKI